MSGLPSAGGGHGARHRLVLPDMVSEFLAPAASTAGAANNNNKRKRRPAGTPDPGAEVVALSPKTLMESDRYVCEICNQGFQRDQNLQMHRRRHKVPWKLLKKPSSLGTNKRVYICPERSCLHHDPTHALGDLVGIKKHYRRKHCTEKQWKCVKCSKRYAVQSDYKAHLKTCGTRGHCCDCGRVFSRVESFIEHQDTCGAVKHKSMQSGAGDSRKLHHDVTDGISHDTSRSQSSDTTQAMSTFAHSGMSERSGDSISHQQQGPSSSTADVDHHSRRIENSQQTTSSTAAANYINAAMPAWLMEVRGNSTKLEQLLQQPQRRPPASSDFPGMIRRVVVDHSINSSELNSLRESKTSMSSLPEEEDPSTSPSLQLSIGPSVRTGSVDQVTASVDMHIPCLRLSIGRSSSSADEMASCPSPLYADTKPAVLSNFGGTVGRETLALVRNNSHQSRVASLDSYNKSRSHSGNDLALWIPEPGARNQTVEGPPGTPDQSLRDFLAQAWRPGAMQGCVSR